jgi:hypothetical protein
LSRLHALLTFFAGAGIMTRSVGKENLLSVIAP